VDCRIRAAGWEQRGFATERPYLSVRTARKLSRRSWEAAGPPSILSHVLQGTDRHFDHDGTPHNFFYRTYGKGTIHYDDTI
jgi:hypothetical protein